MLSLQLNYFFKEIIKMQAIIFQNKHFNDLLFYKIIKMI